MLKNTQTIARLSHWMDTAFEVPVLGWRFGLDALIGLIPGLGDVATTFVSLYILGVAGRMGLPRITVATIGLNVVSTCCWVRCRWSATCSTCGGRRTR